MALNIPGTTAFRLVFSIRSVTVRLRAAVAALIFYPAGVALTAQAQVGLLIAIVIGRIAIESAVSQ